MRLARITVKNYRTFAGDHEFLLSDGVNCFVGPNNCGKSNLFRAVALAMDPSLPFRREDDLPADLVGGAAACRVSLTFQADPALAHEQTLLARAHEYERSVRKSGTTFAEGNEVRLSVTFRGGQRTDSFGVKGAGARTPPTDSAEARRLFTQFRSVVRFVFVRSGESLESLLQGRFRDILQMVIRDHLRSELQEAETARRTYVQALQDELLVPLRDRVASVVGGVFPEIAAAEIVPGIPSISETLSNVDIRLTDAATTDLYGKGTGVRGAVLAAILQYLADQTKRSIVFAVEEPEAFLHPAAQEDLREMLESLAVRRDVTLMLTTHSPFILSHRPEASITTLRKNGGGRTSVVSSVAGSDRSADLHTGLLRDASMESLLDRALSVPPESRAVLIAEGESDVEYLRLAAAVAGREDLLDGLHLVAAGGASRTVLQTVMLREAVSKPVITLLDTDDNGRVCRDRLKRFDLSTSREIIQINDADRACLRHDLEAEDLWPSDVIKDLIDEIGESGHLTSKVACGTGWHYDLTYQAKDLLREWLPAHLEPEHAELWISLLEKINDRVQRMQRAASS